MLITATHMSVRVARVPNQRVPAGHRNLAILGRRESNTGRKQ
jgi:hypothetical protein